MDNLTRLAADLALAGGKAAATSAAVVAKGALNVKDEARANVQRSAPVQNAYAYAAISYDLSDAGLEAEIGYDKDKRGGSLGNILEYGSRKNPPHRDLGRALDTEEPRFEAAIEAAAGKLLW